MHGLLPAAELVVSRPTGLSPFAAVAQPQWQQQSIPHKVQSSASPFAVGPLMSNISDAFPNFQGGQNLRMPGGGLDPGMAGSLT